MKLKNLIVAKKHGKMALMGEKKISMIKTIKIEIPCQLMVQQKS